MTSTRWGAPLPWILLASLTLVTFGGPLLILLVVWGGPSAQWPPDRPLEWTVISLILILQITLFLACLTWGWWGSKLAGAFSAARSRERPGRRTSSRNS